MVGCTLCVVTLLVHSRAALLLLQGQVLTLLLDVAAGMSYLHRRNVLHVSEPAQLSWTRVVCRLVAR